MQRVFITDASAAAIRPDPPTKRFAVGWIDLVFCATLLVAGFLFLRDAPHWGAYTYLGSAQYGDAEFWWNGALHFSHGIVAENPNLTYRMGYAIFGGLVAAVCGPDYRIFHQILISLFLLTACGLYFSTRSLAGRIAAAAAALFLVFNPFSAEWLAISTSDGLGMIFNLAALLALIAGVRRRLRPGWIALFGFLFACGSLTRPLLTPLIGPAVLTVLAAGWGRWRATVVALVIMLGTFIAPTVAWMGIMKATTGNFALTGASQDSSAFYAASDPKIQVWNPDMYGPVEKSAEKYFHTDAPTPRQINAEFWALTRENYRRYWRYHLSRLGLHSLVIARVVPEQSTDATPFSNQARTGAKWILAAALAATALWHRRWAGAVAVAALGSAWAVWPSFHPWAVLAASGLGLAVLFLGNRAAFLWASYWWVGLLALYLTGGTCGPPFWPAPALNALGYRLGFQSFFSADVLVICGLGFVSQWQLRPANAPVDHSWLTRPAPLATRLAQTFLTVSALALGLLLCTGAGIVAWRMVGRAYMKPIAYPDLAALSHENAQPEHSLVELMTAINTHTGARLVTNAMSSGFVWNLPGQQRCILLLYQQNLVQPVHMSPSRFDVETSQHLPDREWMGRQGAWFVRSFPDTAKATYFPYYLEMPAVQEFIPLSADGKSYDLAHTVVFPLTKAATQLATSGELVFHGAQPEWAIDSGALKFPRRFALRRTGPANAVVELTVDLSHAHGKKSLRFGVLPESAAPGNPPAPACTLKLFSGPVASGIPCWQASFASPATDVVWAEIPLDAKTGSVRLSCENLPSSDKLWFYEFGLTADDFTQ